jgi:hypothetical protein
MYGQDLIAFGRLTEGQETDEGHGGGSCQAPQIIHGSTIFCIGIWHAKL